MKIKNIVTTFLTATVLLGLSLWCIFGEKADYSESERRVLAKFPEISWESVVTGDFAKKFEEYAVDRFPSRDFWRSIKAYTRTGVFLQSDNNKIFEKDGHLSKIEYPVNYKSADYAISLFSKINEKYLGNNKVYFSMVPDKNKYISELPIDYEEFYNYMVEGMPFVESVDIQGLLEADDYYKTDTHWRQEKIVDVAEALAEKTGVSLSGNYEEVTLETPFNGVYVGQSALKCEPDKITYLTNSAIKSFKVTGADAVYDLNKSTGRDPYEMFLSGNQPVVTINNPHSDSGRRLIIFRDSFGSSIAPLLAEGYSEVVLIDLRYVSSDMLGQLVDFKNADVLFLYSTLLLNNALAMK